VSNCIEGIFVCEFQNYGYKLINFKLVGFITVSDEVLFIIIIIIIIY